jgi:hypothetical protein
LIPQIWEVVYKKTGEFDSIAKVMDLRGHNTGVNCVCFSSDSTRIYTGMALFSLFSLTFVFSFFIITCIVFTPSLLFLFLFLFIPSTGAKDGVWRAYRINVRYAMGEDPAKEKQVNTGSPINKMELSPDGKTLAIIGMYSIFGMRSRYSHEK